MQLSKIIEGLIIGRGTLAAHIVGNRISIQCPWSKKFNHLVLDIPGKSYSCYCCHKKGTLDELYDLTKDIEIHNRFEPIKHPTLKDEQDGKAVYSSLVDGSIEVTEPEVVNVKGKKKSKSFKHFS